MKTLCICIGAISSLALLGSCAQKKEAREEYKAEHNKDSLRNKMGDSAVANSERAPITAQDTLKKPDTTQTPTNYEKLKPNTAVGGSR